MPVKELDKNDVLARLLPRNGATSTATPLFPPYLSSHLSSENTVQITNLLLPQPVETTQSLGKVGQDDELSVLQTDRAFSDFDQELAEFVLIPVTMQSQPESLKLVLESVAEPVVDIDAAPQSRGQFFSLDGQNQTQIETAGTNQQLGRLPLQTLPPQLKQVVGQQAKLQSDSAQTATTSQTAITSVAVKPVVDTVLFEPSVPTQRIEPATDRQIDVTQNIHSDKPIATSLGLPTQTSVNLEPKLKEPASSSTPLFNENTQDDLPETEIQVSTSSRNHQGTRSFESNTLANDNTRLNDNAPQTSGRHDGIERSPVQIDMSPDLPLSTDGATVIDRDAAITNSQTSPSHSINSMSRQTSSVSAQITDAVTSSRLQTSGETSRVEIELKPPELGKVSIEFLSRSEGLTVRIVTSADATAHIVQDQLSQLQDSLKDAGISIENLSVEQDSRHSNQGHFSPRDGGTNSPRRKGAANHKATESRVETDLTRISSTIDITV